MISFLSPRAALIFSRLQDGGQHHLSKLKKDKPKVAFRLEQQLTGVMKLLPPTPPAGVLSLADQGRFALGYYHQKAKWMEAVAAAQLRKQQKTDTDTTTQGV